MAKKKSANAYQTLIRILLVLFVLVVLFGAGYILMERTIVTQTEENQLYAQQENEASQRQYQQAVSEWKNQQKKPEAPQWPQAKQDGWDVVDLTGFPVNNAYDYHADRETLLMGGMMLVNRWHELPADFYDVAGANILGVHSTDKNIPVKDGSVKLLPNALSALSVMIKEAETQAQLTNFLIEEGYRSMEKQEQLYADVESDYTSRFSGEALKQKTISAGVNYPGTSEYQSGFSFNPRRYNSGDSEFNKVKFYDTPHSDWLVENSWKYGFVFRFPVEGYPNETVADKSYKTGEAKKLMIYRYVGEGHAAVMHTKGMCMEEYIEYLMAHPHIAVYENGKLKYEITRIAADTTNGAVVELSGNAKDFSVSMDNCGGVIVCMSY